MAERIGEGVAELDLANILHRVADGDADAFEELYRRTSARLLGVCLRILPDRGAAEDALQDCFVAIWRRAGSFDAQRGAPLTWLATIARNQAVDILRARRNVALLPIEDAPEVPDDAPGVVDLLLAREVRDLLTRCLRELRAGELGLIRAAHFEGSTYAEIAERSSTPLGTVKTRIRRALAQLRDCMR